MLKLPFSLVLAFKKYWSLKENGNVWDKVEGEKRKVFKVWIFWEDEQYMNSVQRVLVTEKERREKSGFRVSKWIHWLKEIIKSHRNMKSLTAKMMAFCVRTTFGFPASLKSGNEGSHLSHPCSKTILILHIQSSN